MFAGCINCLIYSPKFWPFKKAGVEMLAAVSSAVLRMAARQQSPVLR